MFNRHTENGDTWKEAWSQKAFGVQEYQSTQPNRPGRPSFLNKMTTTDQDVQSESWRLTETIAPYWSRGTYKRNM